MIRASNLKKTFFHPEPICLLSGISFEAKAGESIAITGRSGEGKTTLLHILGTLEPFNEGELFIQGEKIDPSNSETLRNKHIGFVFQSFNLLEDFTALENVLMPARIGRFPLSPAKGLELLDSVGLKSRANYRAKFLSGGEKQRVALARALCNDPDILLADEPTGNLDAANAVEVGELLFKLVAERNKTLLLVTHNAALADRCDRKFVLSQGTLIPNITNKFDLELRENAANRRS